MGISQHQSPAERQKARMKLEAEQRQKSRQQQQRERGEGREQPFRKLDDPARQLHASEPDRTRRASHEELGAISEYQVEAASVNEDQDPMQEVQQSLPQVTEEGDLTPPRMAVSAARSGVPREPDTVDSDELGAAYLKGAVQDPRPEQPEARTPVEEDPSLSAGEERLLERLVRAFDTEGDLITQLPNLSEIERNLSELSLEAVRYARAAGARTHEEVRRKAGEYLERRAEQLGLGPRDEARLGGDDTLPEE